MPLPCASPCLNAYVDEASTDMLAFTTATLPDAAPYDSLRVGASKVKVEEGRSLGRGGFGEVYKGQLVNSDLGTLTLVAVKVLINSDGRASARFELELPVWRQLDHRYGEFHFAWTCGTQARRAKI